MVTAAERVDVLVVDVANVVGSRPDGWWRDRQGATSRLLHRLASADLAAGRVVVVLEGAARGAAAPTGLEVVEATGSGDDAVAARVLAEHAARQCVRVVTADRGLRARLPSGVSIVGPAWLHRRLVPRPESDRP